MTIQNPFVDGIGEIDHDMLSWYVSVAVATLVREHNGTRGGGHFNLRSPSGTILFEGRFGKPASDKAAKYERLAAEKTERLALHLDHVLSWQSKNDELEQYQGAVRAPNGLLGGFSGFPAEEDEVLVLWVFWKMGWLNGTEVNEAIEISSNSRYRVLFEQFTRALKDQ